MSRRHLWMSRAALALPPAALASLLLGVPAQAASGLNPLLPNALSDNGHRLFNLYLIISIFAIIVFLLVEALLIVIIVRYRRSKLGPTYRPPQWHGNTRLEITWTLIPFLILLFIGWLSFAELQRDFQQPAQAANELDITVTGQQYGYIFQYPQGFQVQSLTPFNATAMVIPTDTLVRLRLQSRDVIHGFWVPLLTGKTDLVPGYDNFTWLLVHQTGEWRGECTELCGTGHASMQLLVRAMSQSDFDAWAADQKARANATPTPSASPSPSPSPASASPSPSPGASPTARATASPSPSPSR